MSNLTNPEKHVTKHLRRIRRAKELGNYKDVNRCVWDYLKSHHAMLSAVYRANKQLKPDRRVKEAELPGIAGRLDPWKGTDEEVLVHRKRKLFNPDEYRVFMDFGIKNRALQYLVLPPLEILADIAPFQYTIRGGMKAAVMHVAKVMSTGTLVCAAEVDVRDCYGSFDGKQLPNLIPLPKEVTNHVLIAEHLHLVPDEVISYLGATGEKLLVDARRGIPQGSAASSIIAETMLAIALREIPDGVGDRVAYGDNCLVMAKNESDAVTMLKALGAALKAPPRRAVPADREDLPSGATYRISGTLLHAHGRRKGSYRSI
jgi:Reverse transcriptase (RNA-dependent DNA polymerase)